MAKRKSLKAGTHVYAKLGRNLPRKVVYLRSIRKGTATISWSLGSSVAVARIKTRFLKLV